MNKHLYKLLDGRKTIYRIQIFILVLEKSPVNTWIGRIVVSWWIGCAGGLCMDDDVR